MGLYCLVNDPLLHPKFSGISVIRKSSCGSGVSKVYFSKLVVIERRQFCLPIRGHLEIQREILGCHSLRNSVTGVNKYQKLAK